jgi:hypothetical protein
MMTKRTGFFAKALMSVVALFVLVPAVSAQNNDWYRRDQNRQRQEEQRRRQDEWRRRQQQQSRRDPRDVDGDGDYDARDVAIIQQQQRNGGYGTYNNNGRYSRRGYGNNGYGNNGYGSYTQSQQTALNAGYNEGIREGRNDRNRGGYRNVNDFSAYRNASKDYNSRYGDRYEYQMYFRRGFENGYNDGLNGN